MLPRLQKLGSARFAVSCARLMPILPSVSLRQCSGPRRRRQVDERTLADQASPVDGLLETRSDSATVSHLASRRGADRKNEVERIESIRYRRWKRGTSVAVVLTSSRSETFSRSFRACPHIGGILVRHILPSEAPGPRREGRNVGTGPPATAADRARKTGPPLIAPVSSTQRAPGSGPPPRRFHLSTAADAEFALFSSSPSCQRYIDGDASKIRHSDRQRVGRAELVDPPASDDRSGLSIWRTGEEPVENGGLDSYRCYYTCGHPS